MGAMRDPRAGNQWLARSKVVTPTTAYAAAARAGRNLVEQVEVALNLSILTDKEKWNKENWSALPDQSVALNVAPPAGHEHEHGHEHSHGHPQEHSDGHPHEHSHGHPAKMARRVHSEQSHESVDKLPEAKLLAVTASPPLETATETIVTVNKPAGLAMIRKAPVQLVVWRRPSVPKFVRALSDASIDPAGLPSFHGIVSSTGAARALRSALLSQERRALSDQMTEELIRDVEQLVRTFGRVSRWKKVYVRLECVDDNACSFWHQDSVSQRLITTYRGPCTEWVHPDVSNETLLNKKEDSKEARSLCHLDVALFKGRGEAKYGAALLNHPGVVHRSPRISGTGVHRVVLVLDIPRPHLFP